MHLTQIIILALIQGLAELLPVSSSAHVIVGEKLMGIDPSSPQATIMLAMLHTGTMFAVIVYFWKAWKKAFFSSGELFKRFAVQVIVATAITGIVGFSLIKGIEKVLEQNFSVLKSESLVSIGTAHRPNGSTHLTDIASIRHPEKPLFAPNQTLTLSPVQGDQALAVKTFAVTADTTVDQLLLFYQTGLEIRVEKSYTRHPASVYLEEHSTDPRAVKIVVVGNSGHLSNYVAKTCALVDSSGAAKLNFADVGKSAIENLFKRLDLLAMALASAGVLIVISGIYSTWLEEGRLAITNGDSMAIGAIQGLCLPFRGLSRSGATISVGLLRGVSRQLLEEFSFALAVVLTPPVVGYEAWRLIATSKTADTAVSLHDFVPSLLGMCFSFLAGLVALKILSRLLEKGQWWIFGVYCLAASGVVFWMHLQGYSKV